MGNHATLDNRNEGKYAASRTQNKGKLEIRTYKEGFETTYSYMQREQTSVHTGRGNKTDFFYLFIF